MSSTSSIQICLHVVVVLKFDMMLSFVFWGKSTFFSYFPTPKSLDFVVFGNAILVALKKVWTFLADPLRK